LSGTFEKVVLDANEENNIGIVGAPSLDEPVCESSKRLQQSELLEEDKKNTESLALPVLDVTRM